MGQQCTDNTNCLSSDSNFQSTCKCGWNSTGLKYCDALPGDQPYIDARAAFREYYDATANCHLASRWGECELSQKYHNWKCKELSAQYYVELLNIESLKCMSDVKKDLPIYDLI